MKCIKVKNVFKSYQKSSKDIDENVLSGFNLTVNDGILYVLIGGSGCGKTTLLSCILGTTKVDNGEISVFNQPVEFNKTPKFANLIGYMPQGTELINQLTIRETFQYFGNLQLMNQEAFNNRFKFLMNFLELSSSDMQIKNLSGGQKKRVSLGVTLIHSPQLLILDEPTVGIDFVLRDKIWTFFHNQVEEENLTILVTTHCLNEAMKAHRCGFLRNGTLIVEDAPAKILEKFDAETMYDAFLKICHSSNEEEITRSDHMEDLVANNDDTIAIKSHTFTDKMKIIKGLLIKDFHQLRRSPWEIFMILFGSLYLMVVITFTIDMYPEDLKFGVVNDEVLGNKCLQISMNSSMILEDCNNYKYSCHFLNHINSVQKVFYNSFAEANKDFRTCRLFGLIVIHKNFTTSLLFEDNLHYAAEIYLDSSLHPFAMHFKMLIYKAFEQFITELSTKCETNSMLQIKPYKIEFIQSTSDLKSSKIAYLTALISFYTMFSISLVTIYHCRNEGVWSRTLINGVEISEIIIAHLINCFIYNFSIAVQSVFSIIFIFHVEITGSLWLIFAILFLCAFNGYLSGFCLSIFGTNLIVIGTMGLQTSCTFFTVTGVIWPLEAVAECIRPLINLSPLTISSLALHEIIFRGHGLNSSNVIVGFIANTVYSIFLILLSYFKLKKRQYK